MTDTRTGMLQTEKLVLLHYHDPNEKSFLGAALVYAPVADPHLLTDEELIMAVGEARRFGINPGGVACDLYLGDDLERVPKSLREHLLNVNKYQEVLAIMLRQN